MYQIDFHQPIHIHFIGIGGISMSSLAELIHSKGFTVSGSDTKCSEITKHLESLGIHVIYAQTAANITSDIQLVVYTAAIHPENPEFIQAKTKNLPLMDRATFLGQVMTHYSNSIAVAGTHGKTTTTSMLSYVYLQAGLDPTITVGGILDGIEGNLHIGSSEHFIMEACEYTNSFLKFYPTTALILNIEEDHLDFFKDLNDIRHSFSLFAHRLPSHGLLVINKDIANYAELLDGLTAKMITYSVNDSTSDYFADHIFFNDDGQPTFDCIAYGKKIASITLQVSGIHNVANALAVCAASLEREISVDVLQKALYSFRGTQRRFERKGEIGGVTIMDDYAHHPTEIQATLTAAKQCRYKQIWCVFQPHTYTRTKAFLSEFAQALSLADHIVLTDIYAARETNPGDISSLDLMKLLVKLGKDVHYFPSFDEIENYLLQHCTHGDLLITMGAGDVIKIGENILGL